jgi:hypothetical protein
LPVLTGDETEITIQALTKAFLNKINEQLKITHKPFKFMFKKNKEEIFSIKEIVYEGIKDIYVSRIPIIRTERQKMNF